MVNNLEILGGNEGQELSAKQRLDLLKTEVYESIKRDFGVSINTAKRLSFLRTETGLNSLENLKQQLKNNETITQTDKDKLLSFSDEKLENLYNAVIGAEKILQTPKIGKIDLITNNNTLVSRIIPNFYKRAISPENSFDQVIGLCVGGAESCESTVKLLIDIGKDLIKGPYHIYLILSGKGEYKFNI